MKLVKPLVVLSFLFAFVANTALGFTAASSTLFQQHNKKSSASDLHLKGQTYDLLYFLEEDFSEELEENESTLHLDSKDFLKSAHSSFEFASRMVFNPLIEGLIVSKIGGFINPKQLFI